MMISDDFFKEIEIHLMHELPFVAYRKPNETIVKALLQTDGILYHISDYNESGFVFAPFDDEQAAVVIPLSTSTLIISDVLNLGQKDISKKVAEDNSNGKETHMGIVETAIQAIIDTKFKKVVISREDIVELDAPNPLTIFKKLLNTYNSAFVYCWYHPKVGLWLGATPETLLIVEGRRLTTMALAGTQQFNGTLDVIWDDKEREEQQFVTDFIVESLEPSVTSLQSSEIETIKAGNLVHLKTTITANLKPKTSNLKQILTALHPTPAVCGLPKDAAKQFILKHEGYHREFYTGFLGELNFKEKTSRNSNRHNVENDAYASVKTCSNLYVNLRCMQLKDNQAFVYVGGGITKDSIPEKEWEETVSKAQVIKSIL